MSRRPTRLSAKDLADLKWAHPQLEHPSLAARLGNAVGAPIESALKLLPKPWYRRVHGAAESVMCKTLLMAITSLGSSSSSNANDILHKAAVVGTGALGGFFGPLALLAELPITTALMLRSIADIARSQGEDLESLESRLACMQVFALGARSTADQAADSGYYGARLVLTFHFSDPLAHALNETHVPLTINIVRGIASRFGVVVSDQVAARMIPITGAASAALLNLVFMQHFQDVARGHFIVRRLERKYGSEKIRQAYERLTEEEEEEVAREFSPLEGW